MRKIFFTEGVVKHWKWWSHHPWLYLKEVWTRFIGPGFVVHLAAGGEWLDSILKVCSNLNKSMSGCFMHNVFWARKSKSEQVEV